MSQDEKSQENKPRGPLPLPWVERIFAHMMGLYGSRFLDMWRGTDLVEVKALWAEKLGGFVDKPDSIKAAINALDDQPTPPSLPIFLHLCREAARRMGDPKPKALDHKLTPEEIERNRKRAAELLAGLHQKMTDQVKDAGSE